MRHATLRRILRPSSLAAALVVLAVVAAAPVPALAQSSSAALGEAIAATLDRPLTPPEAWAVQQTVRGHLGKVRETREAFADRLAAATGLPADRIAEILPPLGRGSLSAQRDPRPALSDGLGRPLTAGEEQAIAVAEAERDAALAPHRSALVDRLAALTGAEEARLLPLLAGLGL